MSGYEYFLPQSLPEVKTSLLRRNTYSIDRFANNNYKH